MLSRSADGFYFRKVIISVKLFEEGVYHVIVSVTKNIKRVAKSGRQAHDQEFQKKKFGSAGEE